MSTLRGIIIAAAILTASLNGIFHEAVMAQDLWQEPWPEELKLSKIQRVTLDSLREAMANATFEIRIDMKMARFQIQQLGADPEPLAANLKSQREILRLLKLDVKKTTLGFQKSVHDVLAPGQRQRWSYYLQDRRVDLAGQRGKLVSFSEGKGRTASTRHLRTR